MSVQNTVESLAVAARKLMCIAWKSKRFRVVEIMRPRSPRLVSELSHDVSKCNGDNVLDRKSVV